MSKKVQFILIFMLIFIPSICFAYTDVEEHWAKPSIEAMSKLEVVKGYDDGSFKPDDNMTRAELIAVINRLLKNEVESTKFIPDNNSKEWYYSEIRKAVASGFVQGDAGGFMRPNDFITREEATVILHRVFVTTPTDSIRINSYSDFSQISEWAREAMASFVADKYIKGYEDNTLKPKAQITRAEVLTLIDRLFGEIVVKGKCPEVIHGNLLISGPDTRIDNVIINGDLIIAEGTYGETVLENVMINGNVILRTPIKLPNKNFVINGEVIRTYEKNTSGEPIVYSNSVYGIKFAIPESATVIERVDEEQKINFRRDDLIVVDYKIAEELHFKSFSIIEKEETNRFDNLYNRISHKKIGTAECGYYYDKRADEHLIIIKRHDIVCTIFLYNIENGNVVDNILNTIELTDGEKVHNHVENTYRNSKLYLKFRYLDYVGIDDSYNTNVIYEGNPYFMLFIQVTSITDMDKYTIEELKFLFDSLAESEGEVIDSTIKKVYQYEAIDYTIKDGDKLNRSLYIVVENRLYKLIFTGEEEKVISIGNELFNNIIDSIEM